MTTFDKASWSSVTVAFLVAAIVSAILFSVFTFMTDQSGLRGPGYALILLLLGFGFSFIAIAILALPLLFVIVRLRLFNLWSTVVAGLIVGATMAGFTEWPETGLNALINFAWDDHAVRRIFALAVIGGIAALGFWLTWRVKAKSQHA